MAKSSDNTSLIRRLSESLHFFIGILLISVGVISVLVLEISVYLVGSIDNRLMIDAFIFFLVIFPGYGLLSHSRQLKLKRLELSAEVVYEFIPADAVIEKYKDNREFRKYYFLPEIKKDLSKGKLDPSSLFRSYENGLHNETEKGSWGEFPQTLYNTLELEKERVISTYQIKEKVSLGFWFIVFVIAILGAIYFIVGILNLALESMSWFDIAYILGAIVGGIYMVYIANKLHPLLGLFTALGVFKLWLIILAKLQ